MYTHCYSDSTVAVYQDAKFVYIFCGRIDIGYTDELAIVEICFCCLWSDLSVGVS